MTTMMDVAIVAMPCSSKHRILSRRSSLLYRFFLLACYNLAWSSTPCSSWVLSQQQQQHQLQKQVTVGPFQLASSSYDDTDAKSQFGTKEYWDETYQGRGDFPMDEYQWYFGFEEYGKFVESYVPSKDAEVLIPGIGNDPILLDLLQKGYKRLTATDYSEFAIDRQQDLLSYEGYPFVTDLNDLDDCEEDSPTPTLLLEMDARKMPNQWAQRFDTIIEKGALDAIYLSGDGNAELASLEFERILKPGGILISVSGVVPMDLRKQIFKDWKWIRDGSEDLAAGCFILQKT